MSLTTALDSPSEDEAFVLRMTHDSDRWVREDISHTVSMLRKLFSEHDLTEVHRHRSYLEKYKTFIQARKALDANHPMRKIILKRMAAMCAPLEELLNNQFIKNILGISESPTSVDVSGPRQRRRVTPSANTIRDEIGAYSLFSQVGRDLDLLHIYFLMDPSKYVQNTV
jgi:hypothetical protein